MYSAAALAAIAANLGITYQFSLCAARQVVFDGAPRVVASICRIKTWCLGEYGWKGEECFKCRNIMVMRIGWNASVYYYWYLLRLAFRAPANITVANIVGLKRGASKARRHGNSPMV